MNTTKMSAPLYPVTFETRAGSRIGFLNRHGDMVFDVAGDLPLGVLTDCAYIRPDRKRSELVLLDQTGQEINRIEGDWARTFSDGYCVVQIEHNDPDPIRIGSFNHGLVDSSGKLVAKVVFADMTDVQEGFYARRKKETHLYSLYSVRGKLVISDVRLTAPHVSEGIVAACSPENNGVLGYRRVDGSWLIEPQFDTARPFFKGRAAVVRLVKRKYIASMIDKTGAEAVKLPGIQGFGDSFTADGLIGFYSPKRIGYMDIEGNIVVAGNYRLMERMECGAAPVNVGEKWGLLGVDGKWRREPEFGGFRRQHGPFYSFSQGRLPIGQEFVLNPEGKTIWPQNK